MHRIYWYQGETLTAIWFWKPRPTIEIDCNGIHLDGIQICPASNGERNLQYEVE